MSLLLPSLSSDDDDDDDDKTSERRRRKVDAVASDDDNEEEEDDDEVDDSFEFGGILGEDGVLPFPMMGSASAASMAAAAGWSSTTPTDEVTVGHDDHDDDEVGPSLVPPRMDVASLIAAKRKSFQQQSQNQQKRKRDEKEEVDDVENKGGDGDSEADGGDGNSSSEESDDSSDGDDDDDDDNDEKEIMIDELHGDMEEEKDVLKTRSGRDGREDDDDNDNSNDDASSSNFREGDNDEDEMEEGGDREEAAKAAAFFDQEASLDPFLKRRQRGDGDYGNGAEVFAQLSLSRPLLRGVAAMGFTKPTPVQSAVIPLALAGRDVCASAVTGSGKTAAFLLPILERLLHRHRGLRSSILAVVLTPTRELAAQCFDMLSVMGKFARPAIRSALVVGGAKNVNAQAAELRTRPSVVVATPGRLLDHATNSPGVHLSDVEFLVLDEADRLLDLGFQDEVHELVKVCPTERRQTMLFSATMNTKVDDLVRLSLKRPVRVRIRSDGGGGNENSPRLKDGLQVAPRLEQEFVRIRAGNEGTNREGILLALLSRTFPKQTIVFFDTKVAAHRAMIVAGLCGIRCTELHGNLSQPQRLQALEDFRQGDVDVLLATDLAARGLDITAVQTVINYEMPSSVETYIHRIGRTARAGRGGRSCTLIGEGRRHLMKGLIREAVRAKNDDDGKKKKTKKKTESMTRVGGGGTAGGPVIRSRTVPPAVVTHFATRIRSLEPHIQEVLKAEAVARMDRLAEMEAVRAQNIIEHADEIRSRPQRQWFASKRDKERTQQATAAEHQRRQQQQKLINAEGTGTHRMTRKKRRAREARDALAAASAEEADDRGGNDNNGDKNDNGGEREKDNKASKASAGDASSRIKSNVRAHKREVEFKAKEAAAKSIREEEAERLLEKQQRRRGSQPETSTTTVTKRKGRGAKTFGDAAGDASLFDDERVSYARKRTKQEEQRWRTSSAAIQSSRYHLRGYDPDKKLGKKRGVKKFKSKSKYKRR